MRSLYAMVMRLLEIHMFETEDDITSAIQVGAILPEQLIHSTCIDCKGGVGYAGLDFEPFVIVIDENDQDWLVCCDCAKPVLNYVDSFFPPIVRSHFLHLEKLDDHIEDDDFL